MNWIDTAAVYGLGHSEDYRRPSYSRRAPYSPDISSPNAAWSGTNPARFSHNLQATPFVGSRGQSQTVEGSTPSISIKFIGRRGPEIPKVLRPGRLKRQLARWRNSRRKGRSATSGVSNFNAQQMQRALHVAPIASLQPPYSLSRLRSSHRFFPSLCSTKSASSSIPQWRPAAERRHDSRNGVAALPEDDWRKHSPNFQEPLLFPQSALVGNAPRPLGKRHKATHRARWPSPWTLRESRCDGLRSSVFAALNRQAALPALAKIKLSPQDILQIEQGLTRLGSVRRVDGGIDSAMIKNLREDPPSITNGRAQEGRNVENAV